MAAPPWVDLVGPGGVVASIRGDTLAEQTALIADQQARWKRRGDGIAWATAILDYLATMQTRAADNLQDYGDGSLGIPGFPNIGQEWPSNQSQQINVLHAAATRSLFNDFVVAHLLRILVAVVRDLVRDSDIDLPDPPQLG